MHEEIQTMIEKMMVRIMKEVKGMDITVPFPRMAYDEAMGSYGSDKPDTRFDMKLVDLSEIFQNSSFKVFAGAVSKGGQVKAINVKNGAVTYSRKDIDGLTEFAARYGAKGLAWLKAEEEGLKGPIVKFFTEEELNALNDALAVEKDDLILFVADKKKIVADALGL